MRQINVKFVIIVVLVVVLGGGGIFALNRWQVSRNAGSLFTRAKAALETGEKGEALQLLSRYVGMRPNDAEAYSVYAELLLEAAEAPGAGRSVLSAAYSALETAVRKDPDNLYLRQRLAQFQIFINRPGDAREHLIVLRDRLASGNASADGGAMADDDERLLSPGEVDVLLARALLGTGRFEEAADVLAERLGYDRTGRTFPTPVEEAVEGDTDAYILLAALLDDELRATSEAEAVLGRLVEVNADDARAWLAMRGWHAQRGDLEAAADDVRRAIEVEPEDLEALLAEFELKLDQGLTGDAEKAVNKAAELYPEEERVVRAQAMLAIRQGDRQRAIALLQQGLERMPGQLVLLMMLADTHLQIGDVEQTEKTIKQLVTATGGQNPAVSLLQARVSMAKQQWREAQQLLEEVRPQANPTSDTVRQIDLYLGQCYERLGQYDRQLEANQRVLSDDPNSVAARIGAASALKAIGRKEAAKAEYEMIFNAMAKEDISAFPQLWNPLLQLRIDEQLEKPSKERDWSQVDNLVDMLSESPRINDAQVAILRADVLVRKDRAPEAIRSLRDASAKLPDSEPLLGALITLALQFEGHDSAKGILDTAPTSTRENPTIMVLEAAVAGGDSPEQASQDLSNLQERVSALPAPNQLAVISAISNAYTKTGLNEAAVSVYRGYLNTAPDDLSAWNSLLRLAEQRSDAELAREASTSIARLAGENSAEAKVAEAATLMLETRLAAGARAEIEGESALDASAKQALIKIRGLLTEAQTDRQGWAEVQLRFADVALAERDLDTAIDRLKQAARLDPGNTLIIRRMISLLHMANRIAEAESAMALLRPQDMQGLERITADIQFRSGNFDAAVAIAEQTVSDESSNADDLAWLGLLLSRSGDTQRATDVFKRLVELDPSRQQAWLSLLALLTDGGQTEDAAAVLEQAKEALVSPERELVAAQGAEMLGRYEDAETVLRQAVEAVDGESLQAEQALASFLIRRGRLDESEEALKSIVDASVQKTVDRPIKIWARRTLAELLADRGTYGDLEAAISMIDANAEDEGGAIGPDDIALQIRLLAARLEPVCWRQALDRLDALEKVQALSLQQKLLEAQLLDKLDRWDEARSAYVSLLGMSDPPPLVYAALIEKLISHKELTTAGMWLEKLEREAGDVPITLALSAKLAAAEDDRETAVEAAKRLMPSASVPDERIGDLRNTAILMEELGFEKAADQLWKDYSSRGPDGILGRAEFLGRLKQTAEALNLIDDAWDQLPLERVMQSGVVIARNEGVAPSEATTTRLDAWFTKARRVDPGSVTIALLEAELRELEGRSEEVEAMYRELMARQDLSASQRAVVANNLAFFLAKPESAEEAGTLIDSAIKQLGPHPDLLDTRGLIRLSQGRVEEAVEDLEEAVLAPTAAKYLHLAEAQLAARELAAARRSLERAREIGLESERLSRSDRTRLEQLQAALAAPLGA